MTSEGLGKSAPSRQTLRRGGGSSPSQGSVGPLMNPFSESARVQAFLWELADSFATLMGSLPCLQGTPMLDGQPLAVPLPGRCDYSLPSLCHAVPSAGGWQGSQPSPRLPQRGGPRVAGHTEGRDLRLLFPLLPFSGWTGGLLGLICLSHHLIPPQPMPAPPCPR